VNNKVYENNNTLNEKILKGVNALADNVASTLGPRGRNVLLHKPGHLPTITKDGVTVAGFFDLDDPFENAAAQVIKQAASQTNTSAGDGTTTATVLARGIMNASQRYLAAGASPVELKRGLDKAVAALKTELLAQSKPVQNMEDIQHIATISANGDTQLGKLVATAVDQAGKDGAITIEEARSVETSLDVVEGFQLASGYLAGAFVTDERRQVMEYRDLVVLVTDHAISEVEDILPVLELVARENKPFVIVAENVEQQALAALIMNTVRGSMKVAAIKAPDYGEDRRNTLKDLALSLGATFISRESGVTLKDLKLEHLGTAKSLTSKKNWTTIVDGGGDWDEIEQRIESLKAEIEQTDDIHECEKIQRRITRLASGVAIIKVGGTTESDMTERKHRVEDALEAVKAAQLEGLLPGGGVALLTAARSIEVEVEHPDQALAVEIIKEVVKEPVRQMATNAGESPDLIIKLLEDCSEGEGYDFRYGKIVNMFEKGIIDPTKVTRCALENATSAAGVLLTTNYAIVEVE
jgi:chaperonin GroEL